MSLYDPQDESCCLPNDIIVTTVPSGFFIGRSLPERPNEPQWEYVGIRTSFSEALALARQEAARLSSRAWLQREGSYYYRIPDDPTAAFGFDDDGNIQH